MGSPAVVRARCGAGTQGRSPRTARSVSTRTPPGSSQIACAPSRQTLNRSTMAVPPWHRSTIGFAETITAAPQSAGSGAARASTASAPSGANHRQESPSQAGSPAPSSASSGSIRAGPAAQYCTQGVAGELVDAAPGLQPDPARRAKADQPRVGRDEQVRRPQQQPGRRGRPPAREARAIARGYARDRARRRRA